MPGIVGQIAAKAKAQVRTAKEMRHAGTGEVGADLPWIMNTFLSSPGIDCHMAECQFSESTKQGVRHDGVRIQGQGICSQPPLEYSASAIGS
jgi:hypothetical protein